VAFTGSFVIPGNLDVGIQMVEKHYFKSFRSFTLPRISLCYSFGVAARVTSPAVQGIVVTRDLALTFFG
jgi:hypothetical protein